MVTWGSPILGNPGGMRCPLLLAKSHWITMYSPYIHHIIQPNIPYPNIKCHVTCPYMSHPPIFGSPWQHTSLQAREVASTCEPDTADWCLKMADDYPERNHRFPRFSRYIVHYFHQSNLPWEFGNLVKTTEIATSDPPIEEAHGNPWRRDPGIRGSGPVQTSHCPASHRSRRPRRSWPRWILVQKLMKHHKFGKKQ